MEGGQKRAHVYQGHIQGQRFRAENKKSIRRKFGEVQLSSKQNTKDDICEENKAKKRRQGHKKPIG